MALQLKHAKLYLLIRNDLPVSAQLAQACHATAEFCKRWQFHGNSEWNNETLVCLSVENLRALEVWIRKIEQRGFGYEVAKFHEPDMGNQMTAIAYFTNSNIFSGLPLWTGEPKDDPVY